MLAFLSQLQDGGGFGFEGRFEPARAQAENIVIGSKVSNAGGHLHIFIAILFLLRFLLLCKMLCFRSFLDRIGEDQLSHPQFMQIKLLLSVAIS